MYLCWYRPSKQQLNYSTTFSVTSCQCWENFLGYNIHPKIEKSNSKHIKSWWSATLYQKNWFFLFFHNNISNFPWDIHKQHVTLVRHTLFLFLSCNRLYVPLDQLLWKQNIHSIRSRESPAKILTGKVENLYHSNFRDVQIPQVRLSVYNLGVKYFPARVDIN